MKPKLSPYSLFLFVVLFPDVLSAQLNQTKPNIIHIISDDAGWDDLHCFEAPKINIPNLDKIVHENMNVLVSNFYLQPERPQWQQQ